MWPQRPPHLKDLHILICSVERGKLDIIHNCPLQWPTSCVQQFTGNFDISSHPAITSQFNPFQASLEISIQSHSFPANFAISSNFQQFLPFLVISSHYQPFLPYPAVPSHFQPSSAIPIISLVNHPIIPSAYHPVIQPFYHLIGLRQIWSLANTK